MTLRPLGRALARNFGWKLGSVLLAVVLWLAIVGEPEVVTTHSVPILYRNLPADLLMGQDAIDSVRVELRGPAGRLSTAALADLAVELDLANTKNPGERTFTLSEGDLRIPDGVAFVRAIPSQLRMHFSRRKSKNVPVEVRFAALPPEGYNIVRQEVSPDTIQVAGPEHRIDATTTAQTDAIDLRAATTSASYRVNTFVSDPEVWIETPQAVTVKLIIEQRPKK